MKLNIFIIFIILWNMDIAMAASWYNSSWLSRQKITIDSSVTTEDLTDFPYMIKLADSANPVFDEAQSDGDDILFTSVNGTTKLSHEIEKFVSTDGSEEFIIWVKLPTLLSSANTVIYMYYGNSSAANQEDIANVWDGDYVGVWHLNETSGSHADSTLNSNNSTSIVVAQQGTATGQIDGADEFDGNNDYIETADSVSLSVTGNMTIEAWINPTSYASYRGIVGKTLTNKPAPYDFFLFITTGKPILYRGNGSVFSSVQATNPPGTGAFHYVAVTMSDTTVTHYLDGGTNGSGTLSTTISDGGGTLLIGNRADLGTDMYGYLDEIRISKIARGSAWLTACYNSQTTQPVYDVEGRWYNSSWLSRQKITIDSSVTTEDLTDFPYMIKLTDSANPVFDEAQSDGDDILFTSVNGTTKLSHEIEKFVSTDGSEEFIIWVKLPTLLSLTNTVIYMYYGNSSAANQEDIANVWDGDYVGVWHLNETSGSHADSTLNSNNSTSIVVAQQGTATGQIDGADEFDGNNDYIETADSVSLSVTGNMTIEAWINPTSYASYRGIVGKTLTTKPAPYDFYLVITTGKPILYRGNGSVFSSVQATNPPGTGAFHYVAVTMSDTTVTHYLDGGTNGSGTLSTTISDGGGTLLIGNRADLGTDMYGYLDEIRISKIARGSAWLTACKNNQGSPADYQSESGQQDKTRIRNTAVRHLVIR